MKKNILIALSFVSVVCSSAYCSESVTSDIKHALKASYDMNYVSVIGSLIFVLFLIYITGVIYAKLNVVGSKTLKKQLKDIEDTKVVVLSTTSIGNNRTLHVVEVAGRKLFIGAGQNSISLIKDLDDSAVDKKIILQCEKKDMVNNMNLDKLYSVDENNPIAAELDSINAKAKADENIALAENVIEEVIENSDESTNNEVDNDDAFGLYKKYL